MSDMADEIRTLRERVGELEALVGTVRDIVGCQVRNVSDIDVEQHSREIAAALRAEVSTLRADAERNAGLREQLIRLHADGVRMDYLEISDQLLFRRNMPITRDAVDVEIKKFAALAPITPPERAEAFSTNVPTPEQVDKFVELARAVTPPEVTK